MEEDEMKHWYVVHTRPQAKARDWHLENQGFGCFLPRINIVRRHARRIIPVFAPLFTRYLFVRFDLNVAKRFAINGTRSVVRLLTNGPLTFMGAEANLLPSYAIEAA